MKKVFVLDTSVLLHDPKAIFCFEDNEVVIPYAVLEELEHKKRLLDDVGRLARQVIRYLDQLREGGQLSQGVALPGRGKLRIELNHSSGTILPLLSDLSLPDNRILAVTLNLANEAERPVILVTKDITMRVKADALSIQTEDFYNDKKNLTPLDEEVMVINLKDDEAAELYEKGSLPLADKKVPNSCVKGVLTDQMEIPLLVAKDGTKLVNIYKRNGSSWGIFPKNIEQIWALHMLNDPEIKLVNLMGPAGTGKTLLALASALEQTLHQELYTRILCARPIVPLGKDIGYLPGLKEDKVRPYMQPIYDNLEFLLRPKMSKQRDKNDDFIVDSAIDMLRKKDQLEIEVLTYIRGRSIANQLIIIDEAQNLNAHELKTIITRAGEGTKIVLCGDPDQIDHPYLDKESNGLAYVASRLKGQAFYGQVVLVKGERSELATRTAELL
ncbi:PhoH family protein [Desulfitobacterium hafniense DP7]|uniref:PhoH family protein n=1 Tax=Desulfitobacterium hafniense DP7 TaxID=537010 RepID=G9XKX8_DESHA|nr:PhoH family protein [Desulfitobacterium hafniense]EHL07695.1 PhoH family protein [Desulfitobacterium hafniense DP7]